MNAKFNALTRIRHLFSTSLNTFPINSYPCRYFAWTRITFFSTALPFAETIAEKFDRIDIGDKPKDSADVLRKWGCSDSDISEIFSRRASLRIMRVDNLQSKLKILSDIGINSSDLVNIVKCRPRFLTCQINRCLDERLEYLRALFGSKELLLKAILHDPSLLIYDFQGKIRPIIEMYERMGLSKKDLSSMLLSRPTLIPRSRLDEEKMDLIGRTRVSQDSMMYKYGVTLFAISRTKTIHDKVACLEQFGFSEDEVLQFFGRSPLVFTLSTGKVQRNMTFLLGTMKLHASVVLYYPFLLFFNLENMLRPRFLLVGKIEDMGLVPQIKGPALLRALRMTEERFIRAFIRCHPEDVANELMEFYRSSKCFKQLEESSKKSLRKGFPF